MKSRRIDGMTLFYGESEEEAADLIGEICVTCARFIQGKWGLPQPPGCRVYVMTSCWTFLFHSASWPFKIYCAFFFPFLFKSVKDSWSYVGGFTIPDKKRPTVGIKPPRLFGVTDKTPGRKIFIREDDENNILRRTVCHEMMHAFTAHLGLPPSLDEGFAVLTEEKFFGSGIIRRDTLETLATTDSKARSGIIFETKKENVVDQCVRGYWIIRYLEETRPDLLRGFLARRRHHRQTTGQVAEALGIRPRNFWSEINQLVLAHFTGFDGKMGDRLIVCNTPAGTKQTDKFTGGNRELSC